MKRVAKNETPRPLLDYIAASPDATWDEMRDDNAHMGNQAAHACRDQAVQDQKGLCAYCEQKLTQDDPLRSRIEHFHPKSDKTAFHNWSLDWSNMLAVCDGGTRSTQEERLHHPLPANLHCDAHKDRMIQTGRLPEACEGYMLNPLKIPAFPNLFALDKGTGYLEPDEDACANVVIPGNVFDTTAELVGSTVTMLNLNCGRLADSRKRIVHNIDRNVKTIRQKGYPPSDVLSKLIDRYFGQGIPEYFTTVRCFLGVAAEEYLQSIGFDG